MLNFGNISALQCCTGNFLGSDAHTRTGFERHCRIPLQTRGRGLGAPNAERESGLWGLRMEKEFPMSRQLFWLTIGSFLLTIGLLCLHLQLLLELLCLQLEPFCSQLKLFAYNVKVHLNELPKFEGRRPTQKTTHPHKRKSAQTICATLSTCFLLILKGISRDNLYKLSRLQKLCFCLGG